MSVVRAEPQGGFQIINRLGGASDCPHLARWVARQKPLTVGAEAEIAAFIDGKVGHLEAVRNAPNLGARMLTASDQACPVRTDRDVTAIVMRFQPEEASRDLHVGSR